jgi:hypothetical protein
MAGPDVARDLLVGMPARHFSQDLQLAWRQARMGTAFVARGHRLRRHGTQPRRGLLQEDAGAQRGEHVDRFAEVLTCRTALAEAGLCLRQPPQRPRAGERQRQVLSVVDGAVKPASAQRPATRATSSSEPASSIDAIATRE